MISWIWHKGNRIKNRQIKFIKIKKINLYIKRHYQQNGKPTHRMEENISVIYLITDYYSEFVENS